MKRSNWLLIIVLMLFISLASCGNAGDRNNAANKGGDTSATEKYGATEVVYTCPMHPEVTSNEPGQCPKCGMDLVKNAKNEHSKDSIADTLTL